MFPWGSPGRGLVFVFLRCLYKQAQAWNIWSQLLAGWMTMSWFPAQLYSIIFYRRTLLTRLLPMGGCWWFDLCPGVGMFLWTSVLPMVVWPLPWCWNVVGNLFVPNGGNFEILVHTAWPFMTKYLNIVSFANVVLFGLGFIKLHH